MCKGRAAEDRTGVEVPEAIYGLAPIPDWRMSGEAWLQTERTSLKLSHNRVRKRRLVRAFLGKVVACLVLILRSNYGESSRRTARMPPSSLLPAKPKKPSLSPSLATFPHASPVASRGDGSPVAIASLSSPPTAPSGSSRSGRLSGQVRWQCPSMHKVMITT